MQHEIEKKTFNITNSDITFESIYNKPYIPPEYIDEIKQANLLLIPNENMGGNGGITFPETTQELFEYIKSNQSENIKPDIAISDEEFNKLELHSALVPIATFIVTSVALPFTINIVSSFLYDLVKKYHRNENELMAEVNIIVEENSKSKQLSYKGPVSGVKASLESAIPNLFLEGKENDSL